MECTGNDRCRRQKQGAATRPRFVSEEKAPGVQMMLSERMILIKDAQNGQLPLDKAGSPRYTLCQKVRFRAGCDSPLAVKSATTRKGADPVQLRDQRYSPDARNGRQIVVLRPVVIFLQQGVFLFVSPVPIQHEKGFPIKFDRGISPGRTIT